MKDTIFLMEKGTCDVSGMWILNDVQKKKRQKYKNLKKFDPINLIFSNKERCIFNVS